MATETLSTSINSGIVLGASESYENLTVLGTGTINAPNIGVSGDGGSDIRLDKGAFVSGMQDGVASDATLTNAGTISGQTFGVDQLGRYVSNSGTISGITAAINIESGTLSNSSTGIIQGGIGIYSNTGSQKTIVNAGTIIGAEYRVLYAGSKHRYDCRPDHRRQARRQHVEQYRWYFRRQFRYRIEWLPDQFRNDFEPGHRFIC